MNQTPHVGGAPAPLRRLLSGAGEDVGVPTVGPRLLRVGLSTLTERVAILYLAVVPVSMQTYAYGDRTGCRIPGVAITGRMRIRNNEWARTLADATGMLENDNRITAR